MSLFDDRWSAIDSLMGGHGGGAIKAQVVSRDIKTYKLCIYLLGHDLKLYHIPYQAKDSHGPRTGSIGLPAVGELVWFTPENGRIDGPMCKGAVTGVVRNTDSPPPNHPSLTEHSHGTQGQTADGTPGALSAYDEHGNVINVFPNKSTKQMVGLGQEANITQGVSVTSQELHAMTATNHIDQASKLAASLPSEVTSPDDVLDFRTKMAKVAGVMRQGSEAASAAAVLHSETVDKQLDSAVIGTNAGVLASGGALPSVLGG